MKLHNIIQEFTNKMFQILPSFKRTVTCNLQQQQTACRCCWFQD